MTVAEARALLGAGYSDADAERLLGGLGVLLDAALAATGGTIRARAEEGRARPRAGCRAPGTRVRLESVRYESASAAH